MRSPAAPVVRARARRRSADAGFTMVELTVALLAGLIVAMGIVALSRDATNTFHDEARASVAEASLRAAMDRLRADLQRAGYMSTPNFFMDPSVAAPPGQTPASSIPGIAGLQSILIGKSATVPPLSAVNGIDSDFIQISGNMTIADQFDVAYIAPLNGNCQNIFLSPTSPAMYRAGGMDGGAANLLAAFQPDSTRQFIVRLVDDSGRSQFLITCGSGPAAGFNSAVNLPFIAIDGSPGGTPIQTANTTGTMATLTGPAAGRAWVNPVSTVRWEIMTTATESSNGMLQFVNGLPTQTPTGAADATKYDLVRTFIDARNNPVTSTSEVVAEYVADLKGAVSIAGAANQAPNPQPTAVDITSYAFSDPANRTIAGAIAAAGGGVPQRIRSIRVRLVTRAGQADRTSLISVPPTGGTTDGYLYRYCILPGSCKDDGTTYQYARARTLTTEVALPNQARVFY